MIFFDVGLKVKIALVMCLMGSLLALGALILNNPVTLLLYLFVGQTLLIVGMVFYLITVWEDLLRHGVFKGGSKKP